MEEDRLPLHLRPAMHALRRVIRNREPAIRERVQGLQAENPGLEADELARRLVRATRRRVTATGAASGAAGIVPGVGTLVSLGTSAGQGLYALEQEVELALGIAMIYGCELEESDKRLFESLAVIGMAGGALRLRDDVIVAAGQQITIAAFRRLPQGWLGRTASHVLTAILGRSLARRAAATAARTIPLAVGVAASAGFDWLAVTVVGRAATRYYQRVAASRPAGEARAAY